ncbi:hypothetical protein R1flu_014968 [Riccia fluitans]|uniref:GEX2 N-terminal Ig-like domain-containing protein n=1 Tax=Riccia fluitans TaxID=41844 RepID=A0ABD1YKR3_9MARC
MHQTTERGRSPSSRSLVLKPDGKKKYTMRLVVDVAQDPDDRPLRNQDADLYIIAGDVVPENSTGSWVGGSSIIAGSQGRLTIQLMDRFGNKVGSDTGRDGVDLEVNFSASITVGNPGELSSISDLGCRRNGDFGTYDVTFLTSKTGEYNLNIQALVDSELYRIIGSPFSFRVISGRSTAAWVQGGPVDQGQPVIIRVVQKAQEVWTDGYGALKVEVIRALGSNSPFIPAVIKLYETLGIPGGQDVVVTMNSPGNFLLKISSSQLEDKQIEGSPFSFTVKAGTEKCAASQDLWLLLVHQEDRQMVTRRNLRTCMQRFWFSFRLEFSPGVVASPVLTEGNFNAIEVRYQITVASGPAGYAMSVKAANSSAEIQGSPFTVRITPGTLSIQKCDGYFKGGNPALSVGRIATFIIQQKDSFGNKIYAESILDVHNFTVRILRASGIPVPLEITLTPSFSDKDQILAVFNLTEIGSYILQVGDSSGSIDGSPFPFSLVRGPVVTSDQCRVQFVPDHNLHTGMYLNIIITSYSIAAKPIKSATVLIFGITSVPPMLGVPYTIVPKDMKNGTYVATIELSSTGVFSFVLDLFGAPIPGSPYQIEISEGVATLVRAEFDEVWTWMNYQLTFNVLTNDYVSTGSPIFVKIDSPDNGNMIVGRDGTMVYTPNKGFSGSEHLTYEIKDEIGEIAVGEVSITVVPPQQPYISAFPKMLWALEDQPLPAVGGIANLEVSSLEPEMLLSAEFFALHGRVYPSAGMSGPWLNISVVIPDDVSVPAENGSEVAPIEELSKEARLHLKHSSVMKNSNDRLELKNPNDGSNALRFSARLENMNAALKALQYMGLENFNGNDTVYFSVYNQSGAGSTRNISVYVRPVNDPPFVVGPSIISIHLNNETSGLNITDVEVPIMELSVGDPDADDNPGSVTYALAGILQLDKGQFRITIPPSGYSSASYRAYGEKKWSLVSGQQGTIWAQCVRFQASITDWNAALQGLMLKSENTSTQRIGLSLVVDDLGQFGCVGDCSSTDPYSYVIQHQTTIMIYQMGYKPPYRLKAFVKFLLYAMGGIVGLLGVFYLAGKRGLRFPFPKKKGTSLVEFEEGEENYKMIRVYNPLWLPAYQKAESTTGLEPMGTGFEIQQDWKMETMSAPESFPPLGNESMPLDTSSWGADVNFQLQPQPRGFPEGGVRARRFSVKWSTDRMRNSASLGGTQGASDMEVVTDATPPPPPGNGPLSNTAVAIPVSPEKFFAGLSDENDGESNPPTDSSSGYAEPPFSGFGDQDDD